MQNKWKSIGRTSKARATSRASRRPAPVSIYFPFSRPLTAREELENGSLGFWQRRAAPSRYFSPTPRRITQNQRRSLLRCLRFALRASRKINRVCPRLSFSTIEFSRILGKVGQLLLYSTVANKTSWSSEETRLFHRRRKGEGEGGWMCNQQWIERIDCDRMVEKWSDELADCRIVADLIETRARIWALLK